MEIHTIPVYPYRARVCQCPWTSTNLCSAMDAMEIHTIQAYPYRARVCQCPCISTQSVSMPWMQTTLVFCVRVGARLCQCPWKSTNLCSAMDAMEIHTIPVYPYRARVCQCPCISTQSESMPWMQTTLVFCVGVGARLCQCPWKSTLSQSTLIGPGFANAHGHPQIFAVPWMPWKSTLSKSTRIEPGSANAHAYPPSLQRWLKHCQWNTSANKPAT